MPKFKCPQCPRTFICKSRVQVHVNLVHLQSKSFRCSTCSKCFRSNSLLTTHVKGVHLKLNYFQCSKCSRWLSSKRNLEEHVNKVHLNQKRSRSSKLTKYLGHKSASEKQENHQVKIKKFACSACSKVLSSKRIRDKHFHIVHSKSKPFKCSNCLKRFTSNHDMQRHNESVHWKLPKCPQCSQRFSRNDSLKRHILHIHSNKGSVSNDDSVDEGTKRIHTSHGNVKSETNDPQNFHCEYCSFQTLQRIALRIHMKKQHPKVPIFVDETSPLYSYDQTELTKSVAEKKNDFPAIVGKECQFQCEHCQFTSFKRIELRVHTRRNHPDVLMPQHVDDSDRVKRHDTFKLIMLNSEFNDEESQPKPNSVCSMMTPEPEPNSNSNTNKIQLSSLRFSYSEFVRQNACVYECQICKASCSDASGLLKHWRSHADLVPEPAAITFKY